MRKLLAAAVITLGLLALLGAGKGGTYQGGSYGSAGATYAAGGSSRPVENLIPQSEDLEQWWIPTGAAIVPDSVIAAPVGYAYLWQCDATTGAHNVRHDTWDIPVPFTTPEDAVFSAYFHKAASGTYVKLGLRNGTGTIQTALWQVSGSTYSFVSALSGITSYGSTALQGGWTRLWIHVNATAAGLTAGSLENDPYIYFEGDGAKTGKGCYAWGAQYEVGRTRPGAYRRTGAVNAALGLSIPSYTQNGDTATVDIGIKLASSQNVRLVGRVERSVDFMADVDTVQIAPHKTGFTHAAINWNIGDRLYETDNVIVDATAVGGSVVQSDTFIVSIPVQTIAVTHDGYIAGFYAQDSLDDLDHDVPYDPSAGVYDLMDQFDVGVVARQFVEDVTITDGGYQVYGKTDWYREHNPDFIPLVYFYYFGYPPAWSNTTTYPTGTMARYQFDWMHDPAFILKYGAGGSHAAGDTCFATWGTNPRALVRSNPLGFTVSGSDTTWHYDLMARQLYDFYTHSSNMRDKSGFMSDYMNYPGYIGSEGVDPNYVDMDNDGIRNELDTEFLDWGVTENVAYDIANARMWMRCRALMPNVLIVPNGKRSGPWAIPSQVADIDGKFIENWRVEGSASYGKTWELFKSLVSTYPDSLERPAWDGPFNLIFWDNRFVNQPNRAPFTSGPALLGNSIAGSSAEVLTGVAYRAPRALGDTLSNLDLGIPAGAPIELRWGLIEREYTKGKIVLKWGGDRKTPNGAGWVILDAADDTLADVGFHDVPDYENASWVFSGFNEQFAGYPFDLDDYDLPVLGGRRITTLRANAPTTSFASNSLAYLKNIGPNWADKNGDTNIILLRSNLKALAGAHVDSAKISLLVGYDAFDAVAGDTLFFVGMETAGLEDWLENPVTTFDEQNPGESWPVNWYSVTINQLGGHYSFYAPTGTVSMVDGDTLTVDITDVVQAASNSTSFGGLAIFFKGLAGVNAFKSGTTGSIQNAPWIEVWTGNQ